MWLQECLPFFSLYTNYMCLHIEDWTKGPTFWWHMIQMEFYNSKWLYQLPERCGSNFESAISERLLQIKFMSTFCEIALRRMP